MSDLHDALGAGPPAGVDQVTLFVPSVDRDCSPIDQAYWTEQALATFGRLFEARQPSHRVVVFGETTSVAERSSTTRRRW